MQPRLDVCLSPLLIDLHDLEGKKVVIIDIFRATSCMVAGLATGVSQIVPVATIEECLSWRKQGYIAAGERDGNKVEGFDLGNSPLGFIRPELKGKKIVMTTTNGTRAISLSKKAEEILIGSFLNLRVVTDYLRAARQDTLLVCAGWRGNVNMEDTLFAGAVAEGLKESYQMDTDAVRISTALYQEAQRTSLRDFLKTAAHYQRLVSRNSSVEKDLIFNLTVDKYDVLPYLEGEALRLKP